MPLSRHLPSSLMAAFLACALLAPAAQAQVARVIETRGASMVERAGQTPRLLGIGEGLDRRDTIRVSRDSWAVLEFTDQTRITLRPDTVFRIDRYSDGGPEGVLMGLVKGGFRAITGLIGKRNPRAVVFGTPLATIGIRGTEFDVRLCAADCAEDERAAPAPRGFFTPVARVVEMYGSVAAARLGERPRVLSPGAVIYEGDAVGTARDSYVVLAFVDGALFSLGQLGSLAIHTYIFDPAAPQESGAQLSLVDGDAEITTGLLALANPETFLVDTPMGLLRAQRAGVTPSSCFGHNCGPHERLARRSAPAAASRLLLAQHAPGTMSDAQAPGLASGSLPMLLAQSPVAPPSQGAALRPEAGRQWQIAVQGAGAELVGQGVIGDGEALVGASDMSTTLVKGAGPLQSTAVALDLVRIDPSLFDGGSKSVAPGLYVWVRDGGITLDKDGSSVEVPAGNAALATTASVRLLDSVPSFMRFDSTPLPSFAPGSASADIFRAADGSSATQCTVPGAAISDKGNSSSKAAPAGAIRDGMRNVVGGSGGSFNVASGMPESGGTRSGREQAFDNVGKGNSSDPSRFSFRGGSGPTSSGRVVRGDSFAGGLANRGAQSGDIGLGQGRSNFSGGGRGQTSSGDGKLANTSDPNNEGFPGTTATPTNPSSGGLFPGLSSGGDKSQGDSVGVASGVASGNVMGATRSLGSAVRALTLGTPGTEMANLALGDTSMNVPGGRTKPVTIKVKTLDPRPRDDENFSGGGGVPVYMRRGPQPEQTLAERALSGQQGAGRAGDGRTDQQNMSGGGGVRMTDMEKQGGPVERKPTGTLNMDEVLRLDRLVNPGAQ